MSEKGPRGVSAGRKRVRCLGPAKGEHTFLSASPGERICPRCRARQRALHLSQLRSVPVASPHTGDGR